MNEPESPSRARAFVGAAAAALLGAALAQELRKPRRKRTWHGTVARVAPYDFRRPTVKRMREAWWNPEGPLFPPRVFGVGWAVNLGRVARLLRLV